MPSSESDRRLHPVEIARRRQEPESYEEQLVPQALSLIRAVAHKDEEIDSALKALEPDKLEAFKGAETQEAFKEALLGAFGDRSVVQIVGIALGKLDSAIGVLNGQEDGLLGGLFPDPEFLSQVYDIKVTASRILRQLRADILSPDMEPQSVGSTH